MRILLLNSGMKKILGGGERLVLAMAQALSEKGHEVTLATLQGVDWRNVRRLFGKPPQLRERRLSQFPSLLPYTYQIPLSLMLFRKMSYNFDLTINTQGDLLPAQADIAYLQGGFTFTLRHSRKPSRAWFYAFSRAYFTPYSRFFDQRIDKALQNSCVLLANSSYSAHILELETGIKPEVLYPPVDTTTFTCATSAPKEKLIITVERFSG